MTKVLNHDQHHMALCIRGLEDDKRSLAQAVVDYGRATRDDDVTRLDRTARLWLYAKGLDNG